MPSIPRFRLSLQGSLPRARFLVALPLVSLAALSLPACGDDTGAGGSASAASGSMSTVNGSNSSTGGGAIACPDAPQIANCSVALAPSGNDDSDAVLEALIGASSNSDLCFCPGTFKLTKQLSLTVPGVTVRGVGAAVEDTVFDFAGQEAGKDGFTVTSDHFTVKNLWLKNSPGNGIVVTGADYPHFDGLKVSWDAGSVTTNGAYAVYPVKSKHVILENTEIVGAADAGAYVGQCEFAIVRNNVVHGNVAGIEIENTTDAEVYGNKSYDNSAGVLVFNLPNLEKKDGLRANVHDNEIYDNNHENFAEEGSIVSHVPVGTGVLILAADETEIHDNDIHDNESVAIVMVAYETLKPLLGGNTTDDPLTDQYPEGAYFYANTFTNNGTAPEFPLDSIPVVPLESVIWDGVEKTAGMAEFCLGTTDLPSFRNIHGLANIGDTTMQTTDTTPHECVNTPQTPLAF